MESTHFFFPVALQTLANTLTHCASNKKTEEREDCLDAERASGRTAVRGKTRGAAGVRSQHWLFGFKFSC